MAIITKLINNVNECEDLLCKELKERDEIEKSLIGQNVRSLFTNNQGIITRLDKKNVYVNYVTWQDIPVSLKSYENIIDLGYESNLLVKRYLETFDNERKLKLKLNKLSNV